MDNGVEEVGQGDHVNAEISGLQMSRIFANRRKEVQERRNKSRIEDMLENKEMKDGSVASHKLTLRAKDVFSATRPMPVSCKVCCASSGHNLTNELFPNVVRNLFIVDNMNMDKPQRVRLMPHLYHYWGFGGSGRKEIDLQSILDDPKLIKQILDNEFPAGKENGQLDNKTKRQSVLEGQRILAASFLTAFAKPYFQGFWKRVFERFGWWFLGKVFSTLFSSICLHKGDMAVLRSLHKVNIPIIFMPMNRSLLDPLILSWSLVTIGLPPAPFLIPHKAEHPFRTILKAYGGLGCLERRQGTEIGYQLPILNSVLRSYFSELWKGGHSLQLLLEGGRCRGMGGLPSSQLVGIEFLAFLLDMLQKKEIEDAYIVPLSINYDERPDGVWDSRVGFGRLTGLFFRRKFGSARISLAQPFRLKEFWQGIVTPNFVPFIRGGGESLNFNPQIPTTKVSCELLSGNDLHWEDDRESCVSVSSVYGDTDLMYPTDMDSDQEKIYKALTHHCIYDAMNSSTFSAPQLVCFVLQRDNGRGISLRKAASEVEKLKEFIRRNKRDFGFNVDCDSEDLIKWVVQLLGSETIKLEADTLYMSNEPGARLRILHQATPITQLYVWQAALATSIFSLIGQNTYHILINMEQKVEFAEDLILRRAVEICQILQGDMIFFPRCKTPDEFLREHLDFMKDDALFTVRMESVYDADNEEEDGRRRKDNVSLEDIIQIELSGEICKKLEELRDLIIPCLEYYSVIFQALKCLIPKEGNLEGEMTEKELRDTIFQGFTTGASVLHLIPNRGWDLRKVIKNAITNLIKMKILDCYQKEKNSEGNAQFYFFLMEGYTRSVDLDRLSSVMTSFCTYGRSGAELLGVLGETQQ